MADTGATGAEALPEAAWDLRALRWLRVQLIVEAVVYCLLSLAVIALTVWARVWWAMIAAALIAHRAFRLAWLAQLVGQWDAPRRLRVTSEGLLLETEGYESMIPWERVEGFTGVLRHRPGPTAPRTTTGGLSGSLVLRAGGRWIGLARPASGDLEAVVRVIERKLAEHLAKA
jgi:hypothetical protein